MPRNKDVVRKLLLQAAIELFTEKGFEETTATQIATRAGVTERTFFRHFPDKREVLFEGQIILGTALSKAIAEAPRAISPMEALRNAFFSVSDLLEENRRFSEPRQHIISATPALQEREVAKHAAITEMVAGALRDRGVDGPRADLAARAGMAVLTYALGAWFAAPPSRLADNIDAAFVALTKLYSPGVT